MNLSLYNDSTTEAATSVLSSNISTNGGLPRVTFVPRGHIVYETTDDFQDDTGNFVLTTSKATDTNMTDDVSNVLLNYPSELLCFGAICFVVFAIVGVLGNFISILALSKCKRLRNATTAFIINLCVADFLFCSFSMPLSAITFIQKWTYGDVLCIVFSLVRYSNGAVSLFSVIAITVNRYILVVHPKVYHSVYTKRNIAIMIFLIWLVSLLLLLPPLLGVWGKLGLDNKVGTCTILKVNGKSPKMFLYTTAFILPSVVFVACYLRIFFVVRKASKKTQRKEDLLVPDSISFTSRKGIVSKRYRHSEMRTSYVQHRDKKELRVLRVMIVIFILFIVCYFPVSFVKIFHYEYDLPILNVLGYLGVYFSNIINPVVYIAMSEEYRRAYKELFCQSRTKK